MHHHSPHEGQPPTRDVTMPRGMSRRISTNLPNELPLSHGSKISSQRSRRLFSLNEVFKWRPQGLRGTLAVSPKAFEAFETPDGAFRVVRSPRVGSLGNALDERLRSFVVIEVHEGHQILGSWKAGDLVHYVNYVGELTYRQAKERVLKERRPSTNPPNPAGDSHQGSLHRESMQNSYITYPVSTTLGDEPINNEQQGPTSDGIHYHYHYHYGGGIPGGRKAPSYSRMANPSMPSQLTYRDLRQVFIDGSPVPSLEVRRHCIVICLPPLSCVLMMDRILLLVVEDMNMDHLIFALEDKQLRRIGKADEADKRQHNERHKSMVSVDSPKKQLTKKSSKKLLSWASLATAGILTPKQKRDFQKVEMTPQQQRGVKEQSLQHEEVMENEASSNLPLELECFELLVGAAFDQLHSDIKHLETCYLESSSKASTPSTAGGEFLHNLKSHVRLYQDRVSLFDKSFEEVIINRDTIINMELSNVLGNTEDTNPDLEILLEYFDQEIEMFRQRLDRLCEKIESTERLVNLRLSLTRNTMLRWDVASSLAAVGVGLGALITGLFGMNLSNGHESDVQLFDLLAWVVGGFTVVYLIFTVVVVLMTRL